MTSISSTLTNILNAYLESKNGSTSGSTNTTDNSSSSSSASSSGSTAKTLSNTSLQRYLSSTTQETADAKTIFSKLSVDLGGDGKSISKEQLNSYITSAKSGDVKVSDEELSALTSLQTNWDSISSEDGKSATYYSVVQAGEQDTLLSMVPADNSSNADLKDIAKQATAEVYASIMESALGTSTSSASNSSLTSLLNTLLSGTTDENDDANSEAIAKLTNLLSKKTSTIETEA